MARLKGFENIEKLTNEEKETYISFDQTNAPANIFTYSPRWQKHLEKKMGLKPIIVNEWGGKSYECPKSRISKPRVPKVKRILTEEQKKSLQTRMAKMQAARKRNK
jgi:hypothetical protein